MIEVPDGIATKIHENA